MCRRGDAGSKGSADSILSHPLPPHPLQQDVASAANAAAKPPSPGSAASAANAAAAAPPPPSPLPPSAVIALMEMAAQQLQGRGAHVSGDQGDYPPYFDTFLVSAGGGKGQQQSTN